MDPNASLAEQREITARLKLPTDDSEQAWSDVERLVELVESLDEWLTRGGFLPGPWGAHWRGVRS